MRTPRSTFDPKIIGLSLRAANEDSIFLKEVDFRIIEVISENYTYSRGVDREMLVDLSHDYKLHLHGVSLNIGGMDDLDKKTLNQLKSLQSETKASYISDHLCWTRHNQKSSFDLLPFPFTRKMIHHLKDRIHQVQDVLGYNFLLENISTYFRFKLDEMDEIDFLIELHESTGVNFLLDLNNLYVNQFNHGIDPYKLINSLSSSAVEFYHLAGYSNQGDFYFDAHDSKVPKSVWDLYSLAIRKFGMHPTIIERDENIPSIQEQISEIHFAKSLIQEIENTTKAIP